MEWMPKTIMIDVYENTRPDLFPKPTFAFKSSNTYKIVQKKKKTQGTIQVNKKVYYITGVSKQYSETVKTGRIAGGAAIGGILVGPVGAMVGGALGAGKQDNNMYIIDLMTIDTEEEFSLLGKVHKNTLKHLNRLEIKSRI